MCPGGNWLGLTSNWKVRPAQWDDLQSVVAIEAAVQRVPWPRSWFESELIRDVTRFHLIESEGTIGGYCLWWQTRDVAEILNIAVARQFQGIGLGRLLLKDVEVNVQRRDVPTIHLEVRKDNQDAHEFYIRNGYQEVGLRVAYYRDGMDAVLMRKLV